MYKNKYIINVVIFIIVFFTISVSTITFLFLVFPSYESTIYINWSIKLPKYKNKHEVFRFDYREGNDFIVLEYEKIDSLIHSEDFIKISEDNVYDLKVIMDRYYSNLNRKEKEKFDNKINIGFLYNEENYYLFKEEPRRFIIIIACQDDKAYIFESVR